ncbi:MAG: hypothetical protein K1X88_06675 [Nannocystaceae bacterium]|nr:hypothetical protein [Nannocystaceae bacterium]
MNAVVAALVLAFARCFAIVRVQPGLRAAMPGTSWAVAALLGGVLALSLPGGGAPVLAWGFVPALIAELVLGTVIGLVLAWPTHAVIGAATTSALVLRTPPASFVALVLALVSALALALGLHHAALQGNVSLGSLFPLGDPQAWIPAVAQLGPWSIAAITSATTLALALATPALLAAVAVELLAAVASRGPGVAPVLASAVTPMLRLAAVLAALGASWAIDAARWGASALPAVPEAALEAARTRVLLGP